jgi:peptidoglycan/xylan/chitin deacetylase (PgdA/CDA1 family)/N-acetylmuramoyl-L-alanine amidase
LISAFLLALATLVTVPIFPGDLQPSQPVDARLPVLLSADSASSQTANPEIAGASSHLVDRIVAHLQAMGIKVTTSGSSDYLVSPAAIGGSVTATSDAPNTVTPLPTAAVRLAVGFNNSSFAAASGSETHFGGNGDAAWRLASQVQRNVVGGLKDVLAYDTFDRGAVEEMTTPATIQGLGSLGPWVAAYPLFASNSSESTLLQQPGSQDVLSAAIANAIYNYLDPTVRTPGRVAQWDWHLAPSWQPIAPRTVSRCDDPTKVALTYDGGASSVPTPAILNALREAGVHATIFLTADFVDKNPDLVVQMARDGHEFGNHSSTHPDMTTVSSETMVAELDRLEKTVVALTGKSTRPWFRPPFGAYNDRVLQVAADQGYNSVLWTEDSADWRDDVSAATVESRLLRYANPGSILIEHLGSPQSAQVLSDVLKVLQGRGVTFGTLSEVVGAP